MVTTAAGAKAIPIQKDHPVGIFLAVSAGNNHSCGLDTDYNISC